MLDRARLLMAQFYHLYKEAHSNAICNRVIFTDTDSFCWGTSYSKQQFVEDPFWAYQSSLAPYMDTSVYDPATHPFFIENKDSAKELLFWREQNAGKVGLMKDEAGNDHHIVSAVALKAKCYSLMFFNTKLGQFTEKIKCKGVQKSTVKHSLNRNNFIECLTKGTRKFVTYGSLRHSRHQIYLTRLTKLALSTPNDKVSLTCLFVCWFVCLFVFLPICLSACMLVCLCACLLTCSLVCPPFSCLPLLITVFFFCNRCTN